MSPHQVNGAALAFVAVPLAGAWLNTPIVPSMSVASVATAVAVYVLRELRRAFP